MIRMAVLEDLERIVDIYNQAITSKFQTAFSESQDVAGRLSWFLEHSAETYPLLVCLADDKVVGWLSVTPYRQGRNALRFTVEISYFLDKQYQHKGFGSQLLQQGITICRQLGYKTAIAVILNRNIASIKLADKYGFEKWAYLPGIADFDGVECSHLYYGLKLQENL